MKEIGEVLKESREQNGVSIEEAAEDLNYKVSQLEAIESGNYKTFKDIFLLKCMITDYAKYLGLNSEQIIDEFNEYVDKCKKLGYIVDELSFDNSYSADNTDGYNVDLDFEEKDCAHTDVQDRSGTEL